MEAESAAGGRQGTDPFEDSGVSDAEAWTQSMAVARDKSQLLKQVGRLMGAAINFQFETDFQWMVDRSCCGHEYQRFGWFNRHRRAKHG